jgi:hypothetical protein
VQFVPPSPRRSQHEDSDREGQLNFMMASRKELVSCRSDVSGRSSSKLNHTATARHALVLDLKNDAFRWLSELVNGLKTVRIFSCKEKDGRRT